MDFGFSTLMNKNSMYTTTTPYSMAGTFIHHPQHNSSSLSSIATTTTTSTTTPLFNNQTINEHLTSQINQLDKHSSQQPTTLSPQLPTDQSTAKYFNQFTDDSTMKHVQYSMDYYNYDSFRNDPCTTNVNSIGACDLRTEPPAPLQPPAPPHDILHNSQKPFMSDYHFWHKFHTYPTMFPYYQQHTTYDLSNTTNTTTTTTTTTTNNSNRNYSYFPHPMYNSAFHHSYSSTNPNLSMFPTSTVTDNSSTPDYYHSAHLHHHEELQLNQRESKSDYRLSVGSTHVNPVNNHHQPHQHNSLFLAPTNDPMINEISDPALMKTTMSSCVMKSSMSGMDDNRSCYKKSLKRKSLQNNNYEYQSIQTDLSGVNQYYDTSNHVMNKKIFETTGKLI
ncbi:unnamed protein product [Schistosoma turkestanicum]|nr:unnamed protein product [Schistosoma turkestanicum]